jgi:aspartyl/asparaginyl-tRNA synthetase
VLSVLEELFLSIFDGLNASCKIELDAVAKQYPFTPLRYSRPALRMHYREAVALLRTHGPKVGAEQLAALEAEVAAAAAAGDGERARELEHVAADARAHLATVAEHKDDEDLSTKDEKLLGAVVGMIKVH